MGEGMEDQVQDTQSTEEIDPWAAAFAAIDSAKQGDSSGAEQSDQVLSDDDGSQGHTADDGSDDEHAAKENDGQSATPNNPATGDSEDHEEFDGGLDNESADDQREDIEAGGDLLGVSETELEEYRSALLDDVRDKAIGDVAQEFIKRGVMHQNGKLGATVNDPAIVQRDDDGVPHFYNPETKREFTGENPRKQAQEWCDEYNKELAAAFNEACEKYSANLMEQSNPSIKVLEFASTYDKLDPITKAMFDNVIEDYEVTDDDGNLIGYSCDLDKAYAMVNRQIASIQSHAKSQQQAKSSEPTGPAVDMPNSAGAVNNNPMGAPKSLEEAMERLQNKKLDELRSK